MACSTKLLKVFALIWDIILVLFGLVAVALAVHVFIKFEHFGSEAFFILGFGIAILLIAIFGTLGAVRESSRMTKSYVAILVVFIVLQVLTFGFLWLFRNSLLIAVDKTFDELWHDQPTPVKPNNSSQIASIERWLDCCGNVSAKDYLLPPNSCYNSATNKLNVEGCRQKFLDHIAEQWTVFNIFILVLIGVEIICALLSYVLAHSIVNRWRRSKYFPK